MEREDLSNKLMIYVTEKPGRILSSGRKSCQVWKESGITPQVRRELEVGLLFLGNDENNVIANEVSIYFQCLS